MENKHKRKTVIWAPGSHMGSTQPPASTGRTQELRCDVSVGIVSLRHIEYAGTRLASQDTLSKFSIHPCFQTEKCHTEYEDLGDRKVMVESKVRLGCVISSSLPGLRFHLNSFSRGT